MTRVLIYKNKSGREEALEKLCHLFFFVTVRYWTEIEDALVFFGVATYLYIYFPENGDQN